MINFVKRNKYIIGLLVIWIFSLAIRLYKLGTFPATFQEDEVLSGYVGRYILQNGFDIYGNIHPLWYFNKFGDYYIIGPMYLAGLSTYLFGVTEFAVRFPAAIIGSLIVFPMYIFTKLVWDKKNIALLAAILISITPWHVVLSRSMSEGIIGSTILLSGICLILIGRIRNSLFIGIFGIFFLLLTYFIYHPFRIYVPMTLGVMTFLYFGIGKLKKYSIFFVTFLFIFVVLTVYVSTTPWGKGRFVQTSIFSELSGVQIRLQEQIYNLGPGKITEARIFNNKVVGYGREFISQYLSHFSSNFLFIKGGAESRYDVPDQGLFYLTYLFFILFLLGSISRKNVKFDRKIFFLLISLIVIAPIPASLTFLGSPNMHRSVFLGVVLIPIIALGFFEFKKAIKPLIFTFVICVFIYEGLYFWHQYTSQFDKFNSIRRNDGYKELAQYLIKNHTNFSKIYVPSEGNTALYFLFANKNFDPKLANNFLKDAKISNLDNIYFYDFTCPSQVAKIEEDVLIVDRHSCPDIIMLKQIGKIYGVNELLAFKLLIKTKN